MHGRNDVMRVLKILDNGGYTQDMPLIYTQTVRAVIIQDGKMVMQRGRNGEYKIPGGGLEGNEDRMDALCREVLEEAGMEVNRASVRDIGEMIEFRADKFEPEKRFERHTYYYFCRVTGKRVPLTLTDSERELGFECVWETPENIYNTNKEMCKSPCAIRDTLFIKMLLDGDIDA